MFLVDAEFILGLREGDRWHSFVTQILELVKQKKVKNVWFPLSATLETTLVLASHGKNPIEIMHTLVFIKTRLSENNLLEEPINTDDLILAEKILADHPEFTFFDALHGATAVHRRADIVSNDEIYDILKIKRYSFRDFINKFR